MAPVDKHFCYATGHELMASYKSSNRKTLKLKLAFSEFRIREKSRSVVIWSELTKNLG